ncbi:M15 family metallopeptidase [Thiocapsa bogorovii]|uniref:M15 family metallopeptidase n=1 Tax=Thiocapsa bogorovii TaxID=521689 RepID=UPI001E39E609|nr:M15 family metallopeptidase [Thiocapsa bogorovii]UHD17776.1 M15 family metallopeptidase [Thiocapsa bogorovii]
MRKAFFQRLASALLATSVLTSASISVFAESSVLVEPDLVDIRDVIPDVVLDIRYATAHNFIGRPIDGYETPTCLLTHRAAAALAGVQRKLRRQDMSLKLYDCYRPQRAVDQFVAWAEDLDDQRMKAEFYPHVEKAALFGDGYIAARSGHSRGSTVDLTIVPVPTPDQPEFDPAAPLRSCENPASERFADNSVDMGTGFDCFSPLSHTLNPSITGEAMANRLLLKSSMSEEGFRNLAEEWWHYTLVDEPYPETYFDIPVR